MIKAVKILCFLVPFFVSSCSAAQNQVKKGDCEKCAKTLHPLSNTALTVEKDEIFYYEATVHGSVGVEVEYEIVDETIVKFHHQEIHYKNKEKIEKGMTGADEAVKTLAFESKWQGETNIIIKEMFRGEIKNSYTFTIKVK